MEKIPEINIYENVERVSEIHLDGLVLLQIIKHANDHSPKVVTGSLLGMENDDVLEITQSFANPDPEKEGIDGNAFQMDMMHNLKEVNMDNNKIGWYQSTSMGAFCSLDVVENQFQYQENMGPNAVCVTYDPTETRNGKLALKAFRLTEAFYDEYKKGAFKSESVTTNEIASETIFEEIPIKLHNTELVNCWLLENVQDAGAFDRLDLSTSEYLENKVSNLAAWCDELAQEHYKFQNYERNCHKQKSHYAQWISKRKEENKLRTEKGIEHLPETDAVLSKVVNPPSRLESLLITKQIRSYCDDINDAAGQSFEKLDLMKKLQSL